MMAAVIEVAKALHGALRMIHIRVEIHAATPLVTTYAADSADEGC